MKIAIIIAMVVIFLTGMYLGNAIKFRKKKVDGTYVINYVENEINIHFTRHPIDLMNKEYVILFNSEFYSQEKQTI